MQCQSSVCGSRSSSRSSGVLPSIMWRFDAACRSQVSWSPPDATFFLQFPRYPWMVCMMSSMSEAWASFLMSTSSTTTFDFFDICVEYWWLLCFGTALDKGDRLLKYLVSIRDTNTTRFSFTLSMSSCVGKKDSQGSDIMSATCPVWLRESGGSLLRAARMLNMCSILPWWPNRSSRTPTFLSTLSPMNLKVVSSAIHCSSGTLWSWLMSWTSRRVEE